MVVFPGGIPFPRGGQMFYIFSESAYAAVRQYNARWRYYRQVLAEYACVCPPTHDCIPRLPAPLRCAATRHSAIDFGWVNTPVGSGHVFCDKKRDARSSI